MKYKLKTSINDLKNKSVSVGYFANSVRTDGEFNASVAAKSEFGSPTNNTPPRPTLSPALQNNKELFKKIIIDSARSGNMSNAFDKIGLVAVSKVKDEISKLTSPPLKESTLKARASRHSKGLFSTKPLVDTKQMLNAVNYKVGDPNE